MHRRCAALAIAATLLVGCGGGTVVIGSDGFFLDVRGFSDGFVIGPPPPGDDLTASIRPGQSIEFDAGVPAFWSVSVNGGTTRTAGGTFVANGLTVTITVLGPSRIAVDTAVHAGTTPLPLTLTLTAVAQADSRRAARITLQVR